MTITTKTTLLPFQKTGVDFLSSHFHAALGDEPGLGKTVQAIHAAERVKAKTVLVTCPASVRTVWEEHVAQHFGNVNGWDIISYNGASAETVRAQLRPAYDVWIGDEIHFCKTLDSQRTQAIFGRGEKGLARRAKYKWILSGTMAPNGRPVELYPAFKALCPAFKGVNFAEYTQRYCGAFFDGRGWNVKGASHLDELAVLHKDFLLRRTKDEVFPGRTAPLVSRVPLELTARDLRAVFEEEARIGARESHLSHSKIYEDFSQMGDTSKLLRLLGVAKVRLAADFIEEKLVGVKKVAVFAHHTDVIENLFQLLAQRGFQPVVWKGGLSDAEKDIRKKYFVEDENFRVFIGQDQTAGTGINDLQRVSATAIDVEPSWVPGETEQKLDRLDRMGQKSELVNYYMLYARDTLDAVKSIVHERKELVGARLMPVDALMALL